MSVRPAVELPGFAHGLVLPKLLVVLGLATIAWLTWLPHRRAERMAEAEVLASATLRLLVKAVVASIDTTADAGTLAQRVSDAGGAYLEPAPPPADAQGPAFSFRSDEYCFLVVTAPNDVEVDRCPKPATARSRPPFEGYAFPRSTWSYGRSVFFCAEDRPSAFTRNLHAGYVGSDHGDVPSPGAGRPRQGTSDDDGDYQGSDDGRWILLPVEPIDVDVRRTRTGSR
jgi:hypothetical protein